MDNTRNTGILVASLYKFLELHDLVSTKEFLDTLCEKNNVMGTILIANEGINGTIAGNKRDVRSVTESLNKDNRFKGLEIKFSKTPKQPFHRMKVRIKGEKVILIDPGGVAKAVGYTVKELEGHLTIANRNFEMGKGLSKKLKAKQ